MATVGATYYNLSDYQSRTQLDGSAGIVSNMLNKMKPVLDNLVYTTCNEGSKHRAFMCTNLPVAQTIQAGGGTPVDKSNYTNITEITGAVGVSHRIAASVLKASNNPVEFRAMDARNAIEAVASAMEGLYMTGDPAADPNSFSGLKTRLGSTTGELGERVIKGITSTGGSLYTSAYFVVSGPRLTYGLHPSMFPMGVESKIGTDAIPTELGNGRIEYIFTDSWTLHGGLCIEDPRSVARLCNIHVGNLKNTAADDDLFSMFYDGYAAIKKVINYSGARPMIVVNPTLLKYLNKQARSNITFNDLSVESREGVQVTSYKGIPIVESDYITNTETLVS